MIGRKTRECSFSVMHRSTVCSHAGDGGGGGGGGDGETYDVSLFPGIDLLYSRMPEVFLLRGGGRSTMARHWPDVVAFTSAFPSVHDVSRMHSRLHSHT